MLKCENPDHLIFLAEAAEQAERYEEMKEFLVDFFRRKKKFNRVQMNLLSVAFKNIVATCRMSLRIIDSMITQQTELQNPDEERITKLENMSHKTLLELFKVCKEAIFLVDDVLLPKAENDEVRLILAKMRFNYFRYLCEHPIDENSRIIFLREVTKAEEGMNEKIKQLPPNHVIRLSHFLNCSVRLYELHNNPEKALKVCREAFEEAIEDLDTLEEDDYKDATLIMQLMKDNISLWASELT